MAAIFSCKAGQRAFEVESLKHGVFFYHVLTGLRGEAADKKGRITFAGLAAHVGQEVPNDVARLVKGGAVQNPNLKAEYTTEPLLIAKAASPAVALGDALAADLRACERAWLAEQLDRFLRAQSPAKVAAWRKAAEEDNPTSG